MLLFILFFCIGNVWTFDGRNWMSNVNDNKKLSQLAIPGTHDSGAYRIPSDVGETQDWSINQQLENGIRFLDIRLGNNDETNDFEIRHGFEKLGSFNNLIMKSVNGFLARNPTETILMSIKDEDTLDDARLERDYIYSNNHKFYRNQVSPQTKLGDVRGKIVVFNRYNGNNAFGIRWGAIPSRQPYIQDDYNLDTECKSILGIETCGFWIGLDYPKKARLVAKHLEIARNNYGGNHFFVNFASANWEGIYIGNSAKYSNAAVKNYFNTIEGPVGTIVPMDYPNRATGVIDAMIKNSISGDTVSTLSSSQTDGYWGSWGNKGLCPDGQYVYGYRLRSESDQHSGDDTALNDIELYCASKGSTSYTTIYSKYLTYGDWSSPKYCDGSDNPVIGFNMNIEGKQGSGDDTAANAVKLVCKNRNVIEAFAHTHYGSWTSYQYCPSGQAVVGIVTRVEGKQGSDDDTALNGIKLYCKRY